MDKEAAEGSKNRKRKQGAPKVFVAAKKAKFSYDVAEPGLDPAEKERNLRVSWECESGQPNHDNFCLKLVFFKWGGGAT